jgi:hypothetical protein
VVEARKTNEDEPVKLNAGLCDAVGGLASRPVAVVKPGKVPALTFAVESAFVERTTSLVDVLQHASTICTPDRYLKKLTSSPPRLPVTFHVVTVVAALPGKLYAIMPRGVLNWSPAAVKSSSNPM